MKKILTGALAAAILLTACAGGLNQTGSAEQPAAPQAELQETGGSQPLAPLTIATMPALETFPIFIAADQGFFEDEGLEVHLEQFFSPRDRDIAFQADANIDGMSFDLVQLAIYQEAGVDLVATTSTIGLASLIGGQGIDSIQALRGQHILMTSNTSMDYILDRALASAGMNMDEISTDEVPALPTRLEMLLGGQAQGAILPDPFAAIALETGYIQLTDTQELGINPFILAFRRETTVEKLDELQAFYRALNRAVDFLNTAEREAFIDALVMSVGYPEHFRDTLVIPQFPPYAMPAPAIVEDALDFTRERGLLTRELSVGDIVFDIAN
ncbi:MAG: ABC transporter substrate-binding protein [Oscillospiraceae bacterium]|nr:ABC transporter substrate-binding protein [Oscillospiraceae bacterium]